MDKGAELTLVNIQACDMGFGSVPGKVDIP